MKRPVQQLASLLPPSWRQKAPGSSASSAARAAFLDGAGKFAAFLDRSALPLKRPQGAPIAVVVMPWVGTPAPWYAITLALGLARRGRRVSLVWDDTEFPVLSGFLTDQNAEIGKIAQRLKPSFEIARLSRQRAAEPRPDDEALLEEAALLNFIWATKAQTPASEQDRRTLARTRDCLRQTLAQARTFFASSRCERVVIPGGICNASGILRFAAVEAGIPVASFDADIGAVALTIDGIASQHPDIPAAFSETLADPPKIVARIVERAREEVESRKQGRDRASFQFAAAAGAGAGWSWDVVMPVNIDWDSAALGTHMHFKDTLDWLRQTVSAILSQTDCSVAVRQHPAERHPNLRSRMDLGAALNHEFGSNPAFTFIAADALVSTYDMVDRARLVLPHVSTIGIEAAAASKPVIIAGRCYYADLGFVWKADSREHYFDLVLKGARGELGLLPRQADLAWICFYLSRECGLAFTDFTPQAKNFPTWVASDAATVFEAPDNADLITALDKGRPLARVKLERLAAEPGFLV